MKTRLGFIGLGIMGASMAARLQESGSPLTVHTRTKSKANGLLAHGATWADTPADIAKKSDLIFICVTDTPDVEAVIKGKDGDDTGLLSALRPGQLVVDHSTISPTTTRELAKALSEKQVALLDAPVSGGDLGAKKGTLSIMVGGDKSAFDRAEPFLKQMGSTLTYCGPSGAGQLTKLTNQILVSLTNLAVCEAMIFAKKNQLDFDKTLAAVSAGAGGSWQLTHLGPRMAAGDLRPGFTINLQQKDLRLVMSAAEEASASLPGASLVHQLFTAAQAAGHGKDGTQALFTVMEKLASLH